MLRARQRRKEAPMPANLESLLNRAIAPGVSVLHALIGLGVVVAIVMVWNRIARARLIRK
jgi:hypothetical protein